MEGLKAYSGEMLTKDNELVKFQYHFELGTTFEAAKKIIETQYMRGSIVVTIQTDRPKNAPGWEAFVDTDDEEFDVKDLHVIKVP